MKTLLFRTGLLYKHKSWQKVSQIRMNSLLSFIICHKLCNLMPFWAYMVFFLELNTALWRRCLEKCLRCSSMKVERAINTYCIRITKILTKVFSSLTHSHLWSEEASAYLLCLWLLRKLSGWSGFEGWLNLNISINLVRTHIHI